MLTQEIVRELLHYNPVTGVLTWKERGRHWFFRDKDWHWWNKRFSMREAGGVVKQANGYARRNVQITLPGTKTRGHRHHRLAWLWMTGEMPNDVDHINGDACDNRWCNLRNVDRSTNCRNRSKGTNNTSGIVGVNWMKKLGKWRAEFYENGKNQYLGLFWEKEQAASAVEAARLQSGYSPRHGEERPAHNPGAE